MSNFLGRTSLLVSALQKIGNGNSGFVWYQHKYFFFVCLFFKCTDKESKYD